MVHGFFDVPNITIEAGQHYIKTFPLPGNFAFTVPGEYKLHFSYWSLRCGWPGKTEGVDDVSAESNSVTYLVRPEDLPPRRVPRAADTANKDLIPEKPGQTPPSAPLRRAARAKAGRAQRP
jgi:hypothetical protein